MGLDLSTQIGKIKFKNPVLVASGTFGHAREFESFFDLKKLGGIVTKTITLKPRLGNPAPRIVETPSGMLNFIGLQNVGVARFIKEKLPRLAAFKTAVIANVFGKSVEEYTEVVRRLEDAAGLVAYELNLSSPNSKGGGMVFGTDLKLLAAVTSSAKQVSRRAVIAKLTPNVADIVPFAQAAESAGADAISLVNTFTGMESERRHSKPALPGGVGGLSGPAIHREALRLVEQAVRAVKIPVIGVGGILCGADAAEFLRAGAIAVQVGTANFWDPKTPARVAQELELFLAEEDIANVRDLVGTLDFQKDKT